MLALEVVLSGADPVSTLVFDEVDAGVGGRAATEIGRRLALLAGTHQVIVVTHLAQVAAFADRHFVVAKATDGQVTTSGIVAVEGPERLDELARMMAGLESSANAHAHAAELLQAAGR
jgi:DNA repair protein RecN (Recombination protein N)